MKRVSLDRIAAAPVHPDVLAAMLPFFRERCGNAQSLHSDGQAAQEAVAEARERVAALVGAAAEEITFVSCGSEANNLALKGLARAARPQGGGHIVVSAIEHSSVLNAVRSLEKQGLASTRVPVDSEARVDPAAAAAALRPDTVLVSIQAASSDVGTIQPLAAIVREIRARAKSVLVHADAVAAAGSMPLDVKALGLDALSLAGDQISGPKGSGALYVRKGVKVQPQIDGGIQEAGRRSGTENVPAIVGLGRAAEIAGATLTERVRRLTALRDRLIEGLAARIPHLQLTGSRTERLPYHASFAVRFVEGEAMLLSLDMKGIAASSGSACTSKSLKASHVALAMGLDHAAANGSIVFSLLDDAEEADVDSLLDVFPPIVDRLRKMSPLYTEFLKETAR
jgi:cysteine desulfurase